MVESNSNKKIQRERIMSYFIRAAIELMDEENGIHELSIRKVADRAGYNSATLYHYFSNLEELTYYASIGYLTQYAAELPIYLSKGVNSLEKYFLVWECFCKHSFLHPDIYQLLFFTPINGFHLADTFKSYYDIFPIEFSDEIKEYEAMLSEGDIYKREFFALKKALEKDDFQIAKQDIMAINEMNILIYRGMLAKVTEAPHTITVDDAVKKTVLYMKHTVSSYQFL
ncbi:MAG: helix-turn-helix domain-containing protein [Lachnospiraceae bacterium]